MRWAFAAAALSSLALVGAPGAAERPDQIVGTWNYGGGAVTIRPAGTIFEGVVVRDIRFLECVHRAGERMWTIVRTRGGYAGRQFSFGAGIGCRNRIWVSANWRVADDELRFWAARRSGQWPRDCGEQTDCFQFTRVGFPRVGLSPDVGPPPSTQREVVVSFAGTPVTGAGSLGSEYTRSTGGGRIVATSSGGQTTVSGSLLLIHTIGSEGHLSVLVARSVRFPAAGRAVVTVTVERSTSPQCEAGSVGTLVFRDGEPDLIGVAACGWSLEYRDGTPEGSAVSVHFPS